MPRFRFSLAFLLSLTTLAAAFFGYANYRSAFLQREAEALASVGVALTEENDLPYEPTGFWPGVAHKASIAFYVVQPDHIEKAERKYTMAETKEHYRDLERRLRAMGIDECSVTMAHYCAQGGGCEITSSNEFQRYAAAGAFWEEPKHVLGGHPLGLPTGAEHWPANPPLYWGHGVHPTANRVRFGRPMGSSVGGPRSRSDPVHPAAYRTGHR